MINGNLDSKYLSNDTFPILIHFLSYNIHNFHSLWCLEWRGKLSTIICLLQYTSTKLCNSELQRHSLDTHTHTEDLDTEKCSPHNDFVKLRNSFQDYHNQQANKIF